MSIRISEEFDNIVPDSLLIICLTIFSLWGSRIEMHQSPTAIYIMVRLTCITEQYTANQHRLMKTIPAVSG